MEISHGKNVHFVNWNCSVMRNVCDLLHCQPISGTVLFSNVWCTQSTAAISLNGRRVIVSAKQQLQKKASEQNSNNSAATWRNKTQGIISLSLSFSENHIHRLYLSDGMTHDAAAATRMAA